MNFCDLNNKTAHRIHVKRRHRNETQKVLTHKKIVSEMNLINIHSTDSIKMKKGADKRTFYTVLSQRSCRFFMNPKLCLGSGVHPLLCV